LISIFEFDRSLEAFPDTDAAIKRATERGIPFISWAAITILGREVFAREIGVVIHERDILIEARPPRSFGPRRPGHAARLTATSSSGNYSKSLGSAWPGPSTPTCSMRRRGVSHGSRKYWTVPQEQARAT